MEEAKRQLERTNELEKQLNELESLVPYDKQSTSKPCPTCPNQPTCPPIASSSPISTDISNDEYVFSSASMSSTVTDFLMDGVLLY